MDGEIIFDLIVTLLGVSGVVTGIFLGIRNRKYVTDSDLRARGREEGRVMEKLENIENGVQEIRERETKSETERVQMKEDVRDVTGVVKSLEKRTDRLEDEMGDINAVLELHRKRRCTQEGREM